MAFSKAALKLVHASSQYADAGSGPLGGVVDFEYNDAFAIEFWLQFDALGSGALVLSRMQSSGDYRGMFVSVVRSTGAVGFMLRHDAAPPEFNHVLTDIGGGATAINDDAMHHVVVTKPATTTAADYKIYIDSVLQPITIVNNSLAGGSTTGIIRFNLGSRNNGGDSSYFDGIIDDVSIYNAELNQATVTAHFGSGAPTDRSGDANLKTYWRMGDGPTLEILDEAGSSDLTLVNSPELEFLGTGGETTPPVIDNFSPAVGTPLARSDTVSFDVTDNVALRRALVLVTLAGETYCVHDGFTFRGEFSNLSTRSVIAGGYHYTVKRNGGWIEPPDFEVLAIDTSGNEAT